jgi:aminomethyltransferase
VEELFERAGLAPQAPSQASRVHVPVYKGKTQIGKATSTTWSPVLKKMIALASLDSNAAQLGSQVEMEITIEAVRQNVRAKVVEMPFYNPPQKTGKIS